MVSQLKIDKRVWSHCNNRWTNMQFDINRVDDDHELVDMDSKFAQKIMLLNSIRSWFLQVKMLKPLSFHVNNELERDSKLVSTI